MAEIIHQTDVSKWPVPDFARRFYKEVDVNGFKYLAPAVKLGAAKIAKADAERRSFAADQIGANATTEQIAEYVKEHSGMSDPCTMHWYKTLWIPLAGSPSFEEIWEYIPNDLLTETHVFFLASYGDFMETLTKIQSDNSKDSETNSNAVAS